MRNTILSVALLLASLLAFFPPVRTEGIPSWTGRTCLLASEMYRAEVRRNEGAGSVTSTETTSIDLPRLLTELLCVGSFAAFLIVVAGTRRIVDQVDQDSSATS